MPNAAKSPRDRRAGQRDRLDTGCDVPWQVAAALALLHNERKISSLMWDLSGVVMDVSRETRAGIEKHLAEQGDVVPYSAETKALRTVVRTRDDLVAMRVAATNQLAALLDAHWPGAKAIFADIESPIALAFLTRYPTAAAAGHLGEKRLAAFLVKQGYSGRRPATELLTRLRNAPTGTLDDTLNDAIRDAILADVAVLTALGGAVKDLDRSVTAHLGEHPDGPIFTSLPRSGRINAAQVLAEWGDVRQASEHPDAVAALAGITPVTTQSGKHRAVHFRWACNKRFRKAITTFADNSRHASPWAAKIYNDARAANKDHPHAVRILARAWTRIIWRCWRDGVPYDPAKHGNATKLNQAIAA